MIAAPAQDAIKYRKTVFGNGFDQRSDFQGPPSPAVDHTWKKAYSFLSRIPQSQADRLETSTAEIIGDPEHYVVTLEVFHTLHCLDELRKMIWPEYYGTFSERYNVSHEIAVKHQGV